MPSPDVLDGMRAPRSVRLEDMAARRDRGEALPEPNAASGVTCYVSRFAQYRVQITAPTSFTNPVTGQTTAAGREIVAQFEDHVYRNNDKDPEVRKLVDETLQSNRYFGTFASRADNVHFWLASEQKAATEAARVKAALDTLKGLPRDVVDQFVADLKQGTELDHALPPPVAASPAQPSKTRPIPPPQQ